MNAPQKNTIATAIDALTPEQHSAAKKAGAAWAKKDRLSVEILEDYSRVLGVKCTRLQYETAMMDWKEGWIGENPGKTSAACDKAFSRFKSDLEDMFEIEIIKPESDNPLSQQRAAERAAKKKALLEQHAASSPDHVRQQIEKKYAALAKNPTDKNLKKAVKDLETVLKEKTSEENKERTETFKVLRSQVREAANKCTDEETLEAALDILTGSADFDYSEDDKKTWADHGISDADLKSSFNI
jgi:hypothetical protein